MHIALFLGIPVLRSSDINETLRLMMIASQQVEKRVSDCEFKVYSNCIKPKRNKTNRVKLQVVQNLPGIGSKKAKAVLEEFGTLSKVFSANPEGFSKIHGIRKKTASSLFHLINA
jgi:ERCC4-type nuclease